MYTVDHIRPFLDAKTEIIGNPDGKMFDRIAATAAADERCLTWIAAHRADKHELAQETRASFVICDASVGVDAALAGEDRCFLVVSRPKIVFSRIVESLFVRRPAAGVHPTAVLSPKARVHESVHVGPFTWIGDAEIGEGSILYGQCYVHDGVRIGKNVVVHAGCVLGGDGFGFERNEDGTLQKFPHLGGVVIEDDVEIQTLTHVDRGALSDTIIRRGTKIDSCCHIAHNDDIGEDNIIAAHTMFSGSVKLGDRCWVGPSTSFRDVLEVGDDSFIGIGSLIAKSLPDAAEVMGAPARPIAEYKAMLGALKRAAGSS